MDFSSPVLDFLVIYIVYGLTLYVNHLLAGDSHVYNVGFPQALEIMENLENH